MFKMANLAMFLVVLSLYIGETIQGSATPTIPPVGGTVPNSDPDNDDVFEYVGDIAGDSYPWQLSVQYKGEHVCGAILIKKKYAFTSLQCVRSVAGNNTDNPKDIKVVAGIINLRNPQNANILEVTKISIYNDTKDIALLKFKPADINRPDIAYISLAGSISELNTSTCEISGWGTLYPGNESSSELLKTKVLISDESDCLERGLQVPDDHACVVSDGMGSCNTDTGGPMVCHDLETNEPRLYGIISDGGVDCAEDTSTTTVTVSYYYRYWMDEETE